jgi:hypothetical protein
MGNPNRTRMQLQHASAYWGASNMPEKPSWQMADRIAHRLSSGYAASGAGNGAFLTSHVISTHELTA